ncbi:hypothetical protein M407DRAFT_234587 [Tulasnella calospora MUT 4182]|uniref:Uncharacterized protein n=1 Tax=Tulasnella calospora MUT 4182 TaxID=1051891 RepID=A0A0C3QWR4_9AGAM|nr:hypothetical protein M407DRAFT_234587 [Tulasnella calospora MUT 4182]
MTTDDVLQQFRLQLNTFEQGKNAIAKFKFEASCGELVGAKNNGVWVRTVTVTWIAKSLAKIIPVGTSFEGRATTLTGANDAASEPMVALFRSKGFEPKTGRASGS